MHVVRKPKKGAYDSVREPKPHLFFYKLFRYEQIYHAQELVKFVSERMTNYCSLRKNRRSSAACGGELQCYPDVEQTMYVFILLAAALE